MNEDQYGNVLRSQADTWAASTNFQVKLDFLGQARRFTAPEIAEMWFVFKGDVTAGGGGSALGRDAAKLFSNIRFADAGGEVINASGALLRVQEQLEYGTASVDPADTSASGTTTGLVCTIKVTFEPRKAHRPRDFRMPLVHFLEGGDLVITTGALPTNWASIANGTIQTFVRVVDGRVPEAKSRLTYIERNCTQQEFEYTVNGSLRSLILASKLATTGYTSLAAQTTFNSQTAKWPASLEAHTFLSRYRVESYGHSSADEFTLATPGAVALVMPSRRQKTGEMMDVKTFHLNLGAAAPSSGKLLVCSVQDRNPILAAMVTGFGSPGEYQAAIEAGMARCVDEKNTPAKQMLPQLVRRLPLRFPGIVR